MENTSYKRTIGTGFLILYGIYILNWAVNLLTVGTGETWMYVRHLWYCITPLIMGAAAVIIAFPRKSQTNFLCKTGAIIYLALLTITIINNISYLTVDKMPISYPAGYEYVASLVMYLPGMLFLIWGCKLWMPVKILASLKVAITETVDILNSMQSALFRQSIDDFNEKMQAYNLAYEILGAAAIILTLAVVVLLIVWMCRKPKVQSAVESAL